MQRPLREEFREARGEVGGDVAVQEGRQSLVEFGLVRAVLGEVLARRERGPYRLMHLVGEEGATAVPGERGLLERDDLFSDLEERPPPRFALRVGRGVQGVQLHPRLAQLFDGHACVVARCGWGGWGGFAAGGEQR